MTPAEQAAREIAADLVDRVFGLKPAGMRGSAQEQEVIDALLSIAEQARREERHACVRWLRLMGEHGLADGIEYGSHIRDVQDVSRARGEA